MSLGVAKILSALVIAFFGIAKAHAGDRNESKSSKIAVIRQVVREHLTFAAKLEIGVRSQESGARRKEEEGRRKEPEEVFLQI